MSDLHEHYFEAAYLALRRCQIILLDDLPDVDEEIFRLALIDLSREIILEWDSKTSNEVDENSLWEEDELEDDSEDYWEEDEPEWDVEDIES